MIMPSVLKDPLATEAAIAVPSSTASLIFGTMKAAFAAIKYIPKHLWQDYLGWFRRVLQAIMDARAAEVGVDDGRGAIDLAAASASRLVPSEFTLPESVTVPPLTSLVASSNCPS